MRHVIAAGFGLLAIACSGGAESVIDAYRKTQTVADTSLVKCSSAEARLALGEIDPIIADFSDAVELSDARMMQKVRRALAAADIPDCARRVDDSLALAVEHMMTAYTTSDLDESTLAIEAATGQLRQMRRYLDDLRIDAAR